MEEQATCIKSRGSTSHRASDGQIVTTFPHACNLVSVLCGALDRSAVEGVREEALVHVQSQGKVAWV